MAIGNYLDFDLVLERTEKGYRAHVRNSPVGSAEYDFTLPFSPIELENFLLRAGQARRHVRRIDSPEMQAAKDFGGRLFNAAFGTDSGGCFRRSLDEASRQSAGLRVRLHLAQVPELADVPWEYLYHNSTFNRFLSLSVDTPVVRYLDLPEPIRPLAVKPPLQVLVMISNPTDAPAPLDVEEEWTSLSKALGELEQRGLVKLERIEEATLLGLQRRLRRNEYHIFHFIGHGGFDKNAQDGVLLFEDEKKRGRTVSGQDLGALLHNHRSLRLTILNACEGARPSLTDPFAGTAQSLVQQGIPAVIAMQFEISDVAAITFAHEFYNALADGYPVDAALTEARLAIRAGENSVEWGTPVLYLRAPDGRIFDVANSIMSTGDLSAGGKHVDEQKYLVELYTEALSYYYTRQWAEAGAILSQIVAQQADYEDAADKLKEARRQQDLAQFYTEGVGAFETQDWTAALERFEAVIALDPAYQDAAAKLEEARRQKALADLYAEAHLLHKAQKWGAVVRVFEQIKAMDPGYPDPVRVEESARAGLAAGERQQLLAALYSEGLRRMNAGDWPQAIGRLEEIERLEPGFNAAPSLLARATGTRKARGK